MAPKLELPHGYKDAKYALLCVAFLGELVQGQLPPLLANERGGLLSSTEGRDTKWMHSFFPVHKIAQLWAAGGLIFGWNAFGLILKAQGNYDDGCTQAISGKPL